MIKKQHVFTISHESGIDGERYEGSFTIHKITLGDMSKIGTLTTQLCGGYTLNEGGQGIDISTYNLNYMIALTEVVVDSAPEWFVPRSLIDTALLQAVVSKITDFENSFRRKQTSGERVNSSSAEGSSESGTREAPANEDSGKMVEQEVPTIRKVGRIQ